MEAIDAINRKNGYGTIRQAIQGTDCRFDLKREYMSKQFTTNIHDILKVKLNEIRINSKSENGLHKLRK